jgi:cytochrome subunit of sulfide dehydrogenase
MRTGQQTPRPRGRWYSRYGRWLQSGAVILAIVLGDVVAAADPNGAGLADACTSCHGIGGRSQGYIPSIGGVDKATLLRELKAFRAQSAQATIMNRIARAYTDPELEALAGYFSSTQRP